MKSIITIIITCLSSPFFGQATEYKTILDSAKTLFHKTNRIHQENLNNPDNYRIAELFQQAIELNPQSAEARYFLAYTYSRMNAVDANKIPTLSLDLIYKSSEQLEKVIALTPKYSGEMVLLDPYSKLTSEWGSMAMSYWSKNQIDSAIWAFKEGKNRGGFGNFILELNKCALDACDLNSILICSGDNFSLPLLYLQLVENYRTDVNLIDINLLNTHWYPSALAKYELLDFGLPNETLDTLGYIQWSEKAMTINNLTWTVSPSYQDRFLLRADRILLGLLNAYQFQRNIYFTMGVPVESKLSLDDFLSSQVIVDKLSITEDTDTNDFNYIKSANKYLNLIKFINDNSIDELILLDNIRLTLHYKVNEYIIKNNKKDAQNILSLLDTVVPEEQYPYCDMVIKQYVHDVREKSLGGK